MEGKRVVIVGCGLAGVTAAEAVRSVSENAAITMVDESVQVAYARSGLTYVASGKISSEDLQLKSNEYLTKNLKARLVTGRKVSTLDVEKSRVIYDGSGGLEGEDYDSLILATGSQPAPLDIPGSEKPGIFRLWSIRDAESIRNSSQTSKTALVLGASPLALELSEAFNSRKIETTVVTEENEVLSGYLDPAAGALVRAVLEEEGIRFMCGRRIERVVGFERAQGIVSGGEVITADLIVATGAMLPNSALAQTAGLKIGRSGGILVDRRCASSVENIYAAGDCAEGITDLFRGPQPSRLARTGVRMGLVAGSNAAGGSAESQDLVRNSSFRLDGIDICTVGLTATEARSIGIQFIESESSEYQFAFYYPGGRNLYCKLILTTSGVLIGAQFVGPSSSVWGNIAAMMISHSLPISYLSNLETSFSTLTQPYWPSPILAARRAEEILHLG